MKKTGLIFGVLLLILSIIGVVVCLLLPSLTNNRVSFSETKFGLIAAGIAFLAGLLITNISALFLLKARRETRAAAYKSELEMTEGIVLFDENVGGSVTYRNFHRPGSYSGLRKVGFGGIVALTQKRLLALSGSKPVIDVPLTDERLQQMKFSIENETILLIAFDANLFQPEWSGEIEYRFKTAKAKEFLQKINETQNKI